MRVSWPRRRVRRGRIGDRRRPGRTSARVALAVAVAMALATVGAVAPYPPDGQVLTEHQVSTGTTANVSLTSPGGTPSPTALAVATSHGPLIDVGDTTPLVPTSAPPLELTGYVWPIHNARITTWFGPITSGGFVMFGDQAGHDGVDLATYCGDPIHAAHDGTVLYAGRHFDPYLGYDAPLTAFYARLKAVGATDLALPIVVVVDDGNGYRSVYVHLSKATVRAGQKVAAGRTVLGLEGRTGDATGCHLHYELIRMDGPWMTVAPFWVTSLDYPDFVRERVDPLLVLDLLAPGAARRVPGLDPPSPPPSGFTYEQLVQMWRLRDQPLGPEHA